MDKKDYLSVALALALSGVSFMAGWTAQDHLHPTAKECPNGAVGQVINRDGTTYCSYMSGRYRAAAEWRRL